MSSAVARIERPTFALSPTPTAPPAEVYRAAGMRYSDQPTDWRSRVVGLGGTFAVALTVLVGAVFTWHTAFPVLPVPQRLMVELRPLAAPPEPAQEVPEGPRQVEQQPRERVEQQRPPPPDVLLPRPAPAEPPLPPPAEPAEAADPVPQTTAPKSTPAPPAQRAADQVKASWEDLLLAHLERYRRYPAGSRGRREQGVAHVRFRMSREGQVLSVGLVRSSGSAALDRAAIETLRRAQPLPRIPDDKPSPLDLSVPMEFFLNQQLHKGTR